MIASKLKGKLKINSPTLVLLILTLFILSASIGYDLIFASRNSNELFHENVSFDRMMLNRTSTFTVKQDEKAVINVISDIEEGAFNVTIFNPEGNAVYEYEGLKGSDEKEIEIYKGDWMIKIFGGDVKNGTYKVLIQKIE